MSLRQITLGSLAMSSVGILRMMTQLVVLPVLARYLTPEDYGIVAVAMPFVLFAMAFSDAGMSQSLIRTSSKNKLEWSTSFWFTIGLGSCLAVFIAGFGYVLSLFMGEPLLFPIIASLSAIITLQSIATVPGASLQQNHKFPTIAGIEIAAMFISLATTFVTAIYGFGAWALVCQQLSHYVVKLTLTLIFARFMPHFAFQISTIKEHLIFGRDILGNNIISFIRDSMQRVIMGKVLGLSPVGYYTMSKLVAEFPHKIVAGPLQLVLYPRFAAMKDTPADLREVMLFMSRLIALVMVPGIGMIAAAHDAVFTVLLSEEWAYAGYIFMLMLPSATMWPISSLLNTTSMALGRTDIMLRQSTELCVLMLGVLGASVWFGLETTVLCMSLASALYMGRIMSFVLPLIDLAFLRYIRIYILPVITTGLAALLYHYVILPEGFSHLINLFIAIAIGGFAVVFAAGLQFNSLKRSLEDVKEKLHKYSETSEDNA